MEMYSNNENNLKSSHTSFSQKNSFYMLNISNCHIIAHERQDYKKLYFQSLSILLLEIDTFFKQGQRQIQITFVGNMPLAFYLKSLHGLIFLDL